MCIDLHTHSVYSDGTATPAELIQLAVDSSLQCIALTDHDTVEGIREFLIHGTRQGLKVFPGLEISSIHRKISIHILGYGIDHTNRELVDWLGKLQVGRVNRNKEIIHKLQKMGHDIHYAELDSISRCGQTGRPHIARLLQIKGIVQSTNDAFNLYLRKGRPAWVSRFAYSAAESIRMIHQAGGVAVLAHPGILEQHTNALSLLIAELVECGLDGIEAYYPTHSSTMAKKLRTIARKYQLVLTGGSDYHGKNRTFSPGTSNGKKFCPPVSIIDSLAERIQTVRNLHAN